MHTSHPVEANPFLARLLHNGAAAYAGYATSLLEERYRAAGSVEGPPGDFPERKAHCEQTCRELAAAFEAGSAELFLQRVAWCRQAARRDGVPEEHLRRALESLRDTLTARLPGPTSEAARALVSQAIESFASHLDSEDCLLDPNQPLDRLAIEYVQRVLDGEPRRAIDALVAAVSHGYDTPTIYDHVLMPAQREVGRRWHLGELSIAQEHLVSATTRRAMNVLCHLYPAALDLGRLAITAGVAGNTHDLGAAAVADRFEMHGWRALCLGSDLPPGEIVAATAGHRADVVVLAAMLPDHVRAVRETIAALRAAPHDAGDRESPSQPSSPWILVGGLLFDHDADLWRTVGADAYAASPAHAVELGNQLLVGS